MSEQPKKGALRAVGRSVLWVGRKYVWTVTGNLEELRKNSKALAARFSDLRNRRYRNETFEETVERLGLSDTDLHTRKRFLGALSVLYGMVTAMAILFLCLAPLSQSPISHAVLSFGVTFLSVSKLLATRFRVAQIRERRLMSFKAWLMRSKEA